MTSVAIGNGPRRDGSTDVVADCVIVASGLSASKMRTAELLAARVALVRGGEDHQGHSRRISPGRVPGFPLGQHGVLVGPVERLPPRRIRAAADVEQARQAGARNASLVSRQWPEAAPAQQIEWLSTLVETVTVSRDQLTIVVSHQGLTKVLLGDREKSDGTPPVGPD